MYGPAQARTYANIPRVSIHQHTASASTSYPYQTHRPPEGQGYNTSRSISPTALRSRPRAGTGAAVLPSGAAAPAPSARDPKQYNRNPAYNTSAGASTHDVSPARLRSHSQTQTQTQSQARSRSPHSQAQMYPQYQPGRASGLPYQPIYADTYSYAGEDGRVLVDMEAVRQNLERDMGWDGCAPAAPHNGSGAHVRATYAGGGPGSFSYGYAGAYGHEYTGYETRRPAQNGLPPEYRDYVHVVGPPPPSGPPPPPAEFGGWLRSSGSDHPYQVPIERERGAYPPPRAPSPANHYPFANYGSTASNRNTFGERASERREREGQHRRPSNTYDRVAPPTYTTPTASSQADSTASDPLIHNALGWWPDQRIPALIWDLSSSSPPRYMKRPFDAAELASPPFTPPLSRMRLVLDPHTHWTFDLVAPRGQRYITLSSLLSDIASLMHAPNKVPHAFWVRASARKKEAVLRAMLRRTGRALPVVPPHRRPKTRGQIMEEAVVEAAPSGYTNLLVVDLLCEDVMFAGMEFHKGPDEWVLRTTRRWT